MAALLVIQPDPAQADALRQALHSLAADLVIAESLDEALDAIDGDLPDVILLPTLIPAAVEDYLLAYLAAIPGAGSVQILGLPRLERSATAVPPRRWLFPWRRRQAPPRAVAIESCEPDVFTQDVVTYLAGARSIDSYGATPKPSDRRGERRFPIDEVPWISVVRLGGETADLVNVSARGALVRTHNRPEHRLLQRAEQGVHRRPARLVLELESEGEVQAIGRVIRIVPLRADEERQYEVAFAFDEAVGLHLPGSAAMERYTKPFDVRTLWASRRPTKALPAAEPAR